MTMTPDQISVSIRAGKFTTTMQRKGNGAPLVFLHGAGGPMAGAPFLDDLAKRFTVYAPAHRYRPKPYGSSTSSDARFPKAMA